MRKFICLIFIITTSSFYGQENWWDSTGVIPPVDLSGKKILVIAGEEFDWHEAVFIPSIWRKCGAEIITAGKYKTTTGHIKKMVNGRFNNSQKITIRNDIMFEEITPASYNMIYLPGGFGPENILKDSVSRVMVTNFIRKSAALNKFISAICHGPVLLAAADVIKGKKVTGFRDIKLPVIIAGGSYVNDIYVEDGNLLTGNFPHFEPFAAAAAEMLIKLN